MSHGTVLAPSARDRTKIVPLTAAEKSQSQEAVLSPQHRAHRVAWAALHSPIFGRELARRGNLVVGTKSERSPRVLADARDDNILGLFVMY